MDELEAHRRLIQGLDLVARVREGLEAASPAGYQELNTLDYPIMMMYARCRSLFEGIDVLIRDNLAEEGIILARSLFEESLRLMHLAKEGERRWEYTREQLEIHEPFGGQLHMATGRRLCRA